MKLAFLSHTIFLSVVSGVLLILSFPSFDYSFLVWIALVPLLVGLEGQGKRKAFFLSFLTTWVMFSGIFYWIWTIPFVGFVEYVLLALYFSLYGGAFGFAMVWLRSRTHVSLILAAPVVWVALEYLRTQASYLGAPWMLLGHSQYLFPSLIQLSAITGVYGLSFLIVMCNAALAEAILCQGRAFSNAGGLHVGERWRSLLPLTIPILIIGCLHLYGTAIQKELSHEERIRISVIQGNTPQRIKYDQAFRQSIVNRHIRLTRIAARDSPDLIVWPETAVPGDVVGFPPLRQQIVDLARETDSFLLVGSAAAAKFSDARLSDKYYNSLVLFSPQGQIVDVYKKQILFPFGEYVPFRKAIPWPESIAAIRNDVVPGREFTLFHIKDLLLAGTICWENIFPDHVREFVRRGARLVVNASNEGWFQGTAAPYQFLLAMSVFRAVENHVPVIRAANTGISAIIDPYGQIIGRLQGENGKELFVDGVLTRDVVWGHGFTFYTRHGDWFVSVVCVVLLGLLMRGALSRWRKTPFGSTPVSAVVPPPVFHSRPHA